MVEGDRRSGGPSGLPRLPQADSGFEDGWVATKGRPSGPGGPPSPTPLSTLFSLPDRFISYSSCTTSFLHFEWPPIFLYISKPLLVCIPYQQLTWQNNLTIYCLENHRYNRNFGIFFTLHMCPPLVGDCFQHHMPAFWKDFAHRRSSSKP